MGYLLLDEVAGVFHIVAAIGYVDVGGGVVEADELARLLAVGHIDDNDGHFAHDFVVIDPGVEEGIDEGTTMKKSNTPSSWNTDFISLAQM